MKSARADIFIGDNAREKFVPEILAEKWNGAAYLEIKHADSSVGGEHSFKDGKIESQIGNRKHRYYTLDDGGLEYEIEYAERPESRIEVLHLNFPDGLEFFYQGELTDAEKDKGNYRPDNVIGSYAVYWKDSGRHIDVDGNEVANFETGKFCHIYRPEVRDSAGNKAWADQVFDPVTKTITIVMPDEFLRDAVYPLILDPTFGFTSSGGTGDSVPAGYLLAYGIYAPASSGNVTSISIYVDTSTTTSTPITLGIYPDSASVPDAQSPVCATAAGSTPAAPAWYQISVSGLPAVTSGTNYWLASHHDTNTLYVKYDSTSKKMRFKNAVAYSAGSVPDPCPTLSVGSATNQYSIYATYSLPFSAPSDLTATAANGSTDIVLDWTNNDATTDTIRIERSDNGTTGWTEIDSVAYPAVTYTDEVGANSTRKYYRVRGLRDSDMFYSTYTSNADATTAPAAPGTPTVTAANDSNILTILWADNSSDETNWRVERSSNGTTDWAEISTSPVTGAVTTTDDVGARDTTRYYRVRAYRSGDGIYSNYSSSGNATSAPATPTTLAAVVTDDDVALTWVDVATTNTGYDLQRKTGAGSYATIASPTADAVSASDTGLRRDKQYTYKIRAYRSTDGIYSGFSNTPTADVTYEPPTNLQAFPKGDVTGNISVELMWDKNSRYENGTLIERSANGTDWTTVATTAKGATHYENTGLTVNTLYYYRVSAVGSVNTSTTTSTTVTTKLNTAAGLSYAFLKKVRVFPRE